MDVRTHLWYSSAIVLSGLAVLAWYFRTTAHKERALRAYETNAYVVIGLPVLLAVTAWAGYAVLRWQKRNTAL
jgi:hypothetical protein